MTTVLFGEMMLQEKDRGALRLDLTVWDFNKEAIAFYRAMGMKKYAKSSE